MKNFIGLFAVGVLLLMVACTEKKLDDTNDVRKMGGIDQPCYPNDTCEGALVCLNDRCVEPTLADEDAADADFATDDELLPEGDGLPTDELFPDNDALLTDDTGGSLLEEPALPEVAMPGKLVILPGEIYHFAYKDLITAECIDADNHIKESCLNDPDLPLAGVISEGFMLNGIDLSGINIADIVNNAITIGGIPIGQLIDVLDIDVDEIALDPQSIADWFSDDKLKFDVTSDGKLLGIEGGAATLGLTYNGKRYTFTISVEDVVHKVSDVAVDHDKFAVIMPTSAPNMLSYNPLGLADLEDSLTPVAFDGGTGVITLDETTLADDHVGRVLIFEPSDIFPDGTVRKVLSQDCPGAAQPCTLTTEEGQLEMIESATVEHREELASGDEPQTLLSPGVRVIGYDDLRCRVFANYGLKPGDAIPEKLERGDGLNESELQRMLGGAVLRSGTKLYGLNLDIDLAIENGVPVGAANDRCSVSGTGSVRFTGSLGMNAYLDMGMQIEETTLERFKFVYSKNIYSQITTEISGEVDASCTLFEKKYPRIKFLIGAVPVWVTPQLEVTVNASGSIETTVKLVDFELGLEAGVKYKRGREGSDWYKVGNATKEYRTPEVLEGSGSLDVGMGIRVTGLIYDFVGPFVELSPYLQYLGDTAEDPWQTLDFVIDGSVGLELELSVQVLFVNVELFSVEKKYTVELIRKRIWQSGSFQSVIEPSFYYSPRFPLTATTYMRFYDASSSDYGIKFRDWSLLRPDGDRWDYRDDNDIFRTHLSAEGSYDITLSVEDGDGQRDEVTRTVTSYATLDAVLPGETLSVYDRSHDLYLEKSADGKSVVDLNTGLKWYATMPGLRSKVADARSYCANTALGGENGWRLPTIHELFTLGAYDQTPTVSIFGGMQSEGKLWSDTPIPGTGSIYTYTIESGYLRDYPASNATDGKIQFLCVKGTATPLRQFTDNGDDTVSDIATGLMWQKLRKTSVDRAAAAEYCRNLTVGGHYDWYLPSMKELLFLLDLERSGDKLDDAIFSGATSRYWSDTASTKYSGSFWTVLAADGTNSVKNPADKYDARCVRHE